MQIVSLCYMENTPLAAKTLAGTLEMHGWTQSDLAEKSGIHRPTVSLHITGSRPMRDDHLAAYIAVLDKYEQSQLVSAWLQDTLPSAALENILDSTTQRLREEVRTWSPDITPQQQSMLHYWADKIAADPELAEIFHSLSRKAGWHPSSLTQHDTTPQILPEPCPPSAPTATSTAPSQTSPQIPNTPANVVKLPPPPVMSTLMHDSLTPPQKPQKPTHKPSNSKPA